MKKAIIFASILLLAFSAMLFGLNDPANAIQQRLILENMSLNPLAFTENQGQWDEQAKFRANAGGATMWFTGEGVCYQFVRGISREESDQDDPFMLPHERFEQEPDSFEQLVLKASFVGANPNPAISGQELMEYKCNYFIGNDPDEWYTDVSSYQAVYFEEIYPGIDLKYYGNGKQMEYDFIVSPGTDYSQIQIQYEGAKSLSVNSSGELVLETEWGSVIEQKPIVYQTNGNKRQEIEGEYKITGENRFSFALNNSYNPNLPLVIDPVLVYSTYLDGYNEECGYGIAIDSSGYAYVTGYTNSIDFPIANPYQKIYQGGITDVFVTKLSSAGNSLIYSTYLGGNDYDIGNSIAVDASGCAYVTGETWSLDFPTVDSYQTYQGYDVFVTKLSAAGNSLIYSTYLGGSSFDRGYDIALDTSGNAFIVGTTWSADFPIVNQYMLYQSGFSDAFVLRLSSSECDLVYSTYLGGNSQDVGFGIAVDEFECAYVIGCTNSTDFPIVNPFQADQDTTDTFITKLSDAGNDLIYSTYLGGSGCDFGEDIALDSSGCVYVAGFTFSTDFPTVNPYQTDQDTSDIFIAKLSSSGDDLIYGTYLGGSGNDNVYGITVDASGCAYVSGETISIDFPMVHSYQTYQGDWDVIVTKLSSAGDRLVYSTYLGGNDYDMGRSIALDVSGCVFVTGGTWSDDFSNVASYQTYKGTGDIFITMLSDKNIYICGDVNSDEAVNVSDAVYIINYVFVGGDPPDPIEAGDCNCDGICNISDAVYIINYVFVGGNEPCDTDGDGEPDC